MRQSTSPLEYLAAFALVFTAGILSTVSFTAYVERVRRNAVRDHFKRINPEQNLSAAPPNIRSTAA